MSFEASLISHYADVRARLYGEADAPRVTFVPIMRPMQGPPCPKLLPRYSWKEVINRVTIKTSVTFDQMRSHVRTQNIVRARWEASYRISVEYPHISIMRIARIFGKDHSTVLHGIHEWKKLIGDQAVSENQEISDWQRAKNFVPRCNRCDDWRARGLSDRCPSCEKLVLHRFDELREGRK